MRCSQCGAELEEDMLSCPSCGARAYAEEIKDIKKLSEGSRWYYVLDKVMSIPGVKIDRKHFLANKFSKYYDSDIIKIILEKGTGDADGISLELIDEIADRIIKLHTRLAVGASALAGIPGGLALFGTVPTDIVQYNFHALQVAQKLAYLYGFPDLEDDDFFLSMTIFIGVMSGAAKAGIGIKELSKMIAKTVEKNLARETLTKTTIYPIVKQVAKWLGIKMTKEIFARTVSKIIPVVGAMTSGGLTYVMFSREANRLKKKLRAEFLLRQKVNAGK